MNQSKTSTAEVKLPSIHSSERFNLSELKPISKEEQEELDKFIEALIEKEEEESAEDVIADTPGNSTVEKKSFIQSIMSRFKRR